MPCSLTLRNTETEEQVEPDEQPQGITWEGALALFFYALTLIIAWFTVTLIQTRETSDWPDLPDTDQIAHRELI